MNIALLGPSGVGKGTHVATLVARFHLRHVATGDLLRHHLQTHTALGILARKYMEQNELVPDELIDAMIEAWGHALPPGAGALFDGFPRTPTQARFLHRFLQGLGRQLDAVIYLHVPDDDIVRRLEGRLICRTCDQSFHSQHRPPKVADVCDACGGPLYQRPDDTPDMVRRRLRVFHRTTEPLLAQFATEGRLIVVEGDDAIPAVGRRLLAVASDLAEQRARFTNRHELAAIVLATKAPAPAPPGAATTLDLVLLGGPGSGKGTQAALLAAELKLPHIATGDLFRENLLRATELGKLAKVYMERGDLVPDDVTEAMVAERLTRADAASGFILDGFPRSLSQAIALEEMLARAHRRVAGVLYIRVADPVIIERLSGRLVCRDCQAPYHRVFHPPAVAGRCDRCGGELYQRHDDNAETVCARLATFHHQTEPLIAHYHQAGLLHELSGEGDVAGISARALEAVHALPAIAAQIAAESPAS